MKILIIHNMARNKKGQPQKVMRQPYEENSYN